MFIIYFIVRKYASSIISSDNKDIILVAYFGDPSKFITRLVHSLLINSNVLGIWVNDLSKSMLHYIKTSIGNLLFLKCVEQ